MKKVKVFNFKLFRVFVTIGLITILYPSVSSRAQDLNPEPPYTPVKLIFIHHSTGENWLSDGNGDLGVTLSENNYFVSDTNYGWGPNSIGDATDYYNWYDWFVGPDSSLYLEALYAESGQNSPYSRTVSDPGGENRIIIFKSCFPNSDLGGSANDHPSDGEWNTVGHAKYVYNQLLDYFVTRPDKLFIALTPPPLLDSKHAENAREFSRWMVEDWLVEYNYSGNNVAVWDFHNVLTHTDNHHRFLNGVIDYTISNGNGTLQYDSDGDEHPNDVGNRKSTAEFLPMLNVFFNRWAASAPSSPPTSSENVPPPDSGDESSGEGTEPDTSPTLFTETGVIDDFESGMPTGTVGWESFWDEATQSSLTCSLDNKIFHSGSSSLRIDFHVEPDGWATCPLVYDNPPGFGDTQGISFDYRANAQSLVFNFDALTGSPGARATYHFTIETIPASVDGWVHYELTWDQILGVEWEANPGKPVDPTEVMGFAFGFNTYSDTPNSGTIWIDNLRTLGEEAPVKQPAQDDTQASEVEQAETESSTSEGPEETENNQIKAAEDSEEVVGDRKLCPGSTAMIGLSIVAAFFFQNKRFQKRTEYYSN